MYRYCRTIHRFEWFIERCCMFHSCAHLLIHMRTHAPSTLFVTTKHSRHSIWGKSSTKERRWMFQRSILNNGSRNCERGGKKHEIFCVAFGDQLFHEIFYSPRLAISPFRFQGSLWLKSDAWQTFWAKRVLLLWVLFSQYKCIMN